MVDPTDRIEPSPAVTNVVGLFFLWHLRLLSFGWLGLLLRFVMIPLAATVLAGGLEGSVARHRSPTAASKLRAGAILGNL